MTDLSLPAAPTAEQTIDPATTIEENQGQTAAPEAAAEPAHNCAGGDCGQCPHHAQEAAAAQQVIADEPELDSLRDVTIKGVPSQVSDSEVFNAIRMGNTVLRTVSSGCAMLMFPQMTPSEEGQPPMMQVGVCVVPLSQHKDLERLVTLAQVITKCNVAIHNATEQGPANELHARVEAEKSKDNTSRALTGQAKGNAGPGIIVP